MFFYSFQGIIIKFLYKCCSKYVVNNIEIKNELKERQYLYVCWHKHLWAVLYLLMISKKTKIAIVMSNHVRNYRFISFFKYLGVGIIRESDFSESHLERLMLIKKYLSEGYSIFNFSDGPVGPEKKVKPDMIFLASKFNLEVVPIICTFDGKKKLKKSWDNSYIMSGKTRNFYATTSEPIRIIDFNQDLILVEKKLLELEKKIDELI